MKQMMDMCKLSSHFVKHSPLGYNITNIQYPSNSFSVYSFIPNAIFEKKNWLLGSQNYLLAWKQNSLWNSNNNNKKE